MTPAQRGLAGAALALAWFAFAAEPAGAALERFRPDVRGQVTLSDLERRGLLLALPPGGAALVAEARVVSRSEEAWGFLVADLLTPAERAEGLTLAAGAPPAHAAPGLVVEPEMMFLVEALLARYGPATAPVRRRPARDEWPMVDRRIRARALTALVQGPGLDEERAAVLLGATLELLSAQARRIEVEAELAELVGDEE